MPKTERQRTPAIPLATSVRIYNPCTRRGSRTVSPLAMEENGGAAGGSVLGCSPSARVMAGRFPSKNAGASDIAIRPLPWRGAHHDKRDGWLRGSPGAVRPGQEAGTIG